MQTSITTPQDRANWDTFIANSSYGHVLQSWEWGEIKGRTGWQPTALALREGDRIRAAAMVLVRPLPYGFGRLAYVPKGPVLDYADTDLLDEMLSALRSFAHRHNVISLKIEPEVVEPSPVQDLFLARGLVAASPVQMRSTIWVDIGESEEDILARMKHKTRYNIRLSARKGVTVTQGTVADLDAWYEMYRLTAERDGFSIHDCGYYQTVLETLGRRDMAALLLARHEGDLLAGIIVFCLGEKAMYMYGASANEKRNLMAPYLVQWEGMRWARERRARIYDLWGIPDQLLESEDLWGVYRHKRGYGGELVRYIGAYDLVQSPARHVVLERVARPLFKRVARLTV